MATGAALGRVERSATVAFGPTRGHGDGAAGYLCAGTVAGAFDMSFSTTATLELFAMKPSMDGAQTAMASAKGHDDALLSKVGAEAQAHERFHRIAWGTSANTQDYPFGIIAGGMVDGCVNLWNPSKILSAPGSGDDALICPLKKHTGAVKGLQFNPSSPNLLASGGADADLCIWDLANPEKPSLFPALKESTGNMGEIVHLAWNNKVQHILASTSTNGNTMVWDLKRQRQVISFANPNSGGGSGRCSAIQWHPDVATQLVVASDDDRNPAIQVWDLRNSISPLREFAGHTKGVLSLAWCHPWDPTLLLSTGKDNRTLCWDTNTGQVLCEVPAGNNWNFDVQWCPTVPGWFATASFDGVVSVYDLVKCMGRTQSQQEQAAASGEACFAAPSPHTPKWMGRAAGVSCGFGAKLASFSNASAGVDGSKCTIRVSEATAGEPLVALEGGDITTLVADQSKPAMLSYCKDKRDGSSSAQEQETWEFLRILFEEDARKQILQHLGYKAPKPEMPAPGQEAVHLEDAAAASVATGDGTTMAQLSLDEPPAPIDASGGDFGDGASFFDNLASPSPRRPPQVQADAGDHADPVGSESAVKENGLAPPPVAAAVAEETGIDREVKNALFVGDYEAAVSACMGNNQTADALLIASVGGPELWAATQKEYIKKSTKGYMKVLLSIMENDLSDLVVSQPPSRWRETLALLCTYAQSEDWSKLCSDLGDSLLRSRDIDAATMCYICAGNLEKTVRMWSGSLDMVREQAKLQDVMEKSAVLSIATGQQATSESYSSLLNTYADLLASQGQIVKALDFLNRIPGELSESTTILKDRLDQAVTALQAQQQKAEASAHGATSSAILDGPTAVGADSQYQYQQQNYQQQSYQQQGPAGGASQYYDQQQYYQQQQPAQQPSYDYGAQSAPPLQQQHSYGNSGIQQYVPSQPPTSAMGGGSMAPPSQAPMQSNTPPQPSVLNPVAPVSEPQQQHYQQQQQPAIFTPSPGGSGTFNPAGGAPAPAPTIMQPGMTGGAANTLGVPGSAVNNQQAPAAAATPPAAPAAPHVPANVNISNVETGAVPADMKPVVSCLRDSFNMCAKAFENNPSKKREMDDNSKRLGVLFFKLNLDDVKPSVKAQLLELCKALNAKDFMHASKVHISLTTTDFDECGQWLTALKRLIKTRQMLGQ